MRNVPTVVVGFVMLVLLAGCGGDGGCGCDLPQRGRDWFIDITFSHIPDEIAEYPFFVNVGVQITNVETGSPAPDGLLVKLSISPGSFDNGQPEIQRTLINGRVSATVQADDAGVYELGILFVDESVTANKAFSIGL